jgi:hypothetical protein
LDGTPSILEKKIREAAFPDGQMLPLVAGALQDIAYKEHKHIQNSKPFA